MRQTRARSDHQLWPRPPRNRFDACLWIHRGHAARRQHLHELSSEIEAVQDDPLLYAKLLSLELVPGVKFYILNDESVKFHSPFAYAMSVNEEDGVSWKIAQTVDGEGEVQFFYRDSRSQWRRAYPRDQRRHTLGPIPPPNTHVPHLPP